jgi:hypothetical protein
MSRIASQVVIESTIVPDYFARVHGGLRKCRLGTVTIGYRGDHGRMMTQSSPTTPELSSVVARVESIEDGMPGRISRAFQCHDDVLGEHRLPARMLAQRHGIAKHGPQKRPQCFRHGL